MHFTSTWAALFLIVIGATLAEPPAPNYMFSNYDDYDKPKGSRGGDDAYGDADDRDAYASGGGRDSYSKGSYGKDSYDNGGEGQYSDSYNNSPTPQGDDYGYNELNPEKPYKGPHDPMTHSYSPPNHYDQHGQSGYKPMHPRPRPSGYRFRMPNIMNIFRRRPQKVYTMTSHSPPSYSSFGSPSGHGHGGSSGSGSYSSPHSSSASNSNYGGGSSSYEGPHQSSYDSYGGGNSYDRPSKVYKGHAGPPSSYRPVKQHSAPGSHYDLPPVKSYGKHTKPPVKGYAPPPYANQYGLASKGHSSPAIANAYGGVSKGYISEPSSYGRPSKGHRQSYRPSQEYSSGYDGHRNSGSDDYTQDAYGGGFDMGTSHY